MNKKFLLIVALFLICLFASAQNISYQAVAKSLRNMQTQNYDKAVATDIKIVRKGNSSVSVGNTSYSVVTVDKDMTSNSVTTKQYTVNDSNGNEYVIIFTDDPTAAINLMKHYVVIFNTSHPYDWTYYFCSEPKDE